MDIKALVDGYLTSIKLAHENRSSPEPKWPCWAMNHHLIDEEGNSKIISTLYFSFALVV